MHLSYIILKVRAVAYIIIFTLAVPYSAQAHPWDLRGNGSTEPPTDFLGTSDGKPLVIKTNGVEAIHIDPGILRPLVFPGDISFNSNLRFPSGSLFYGQISFNDNVGFGTFSPKAKLHVAGGADPLLLIDHQGASGNPALWFQQDGEPKAYVWWDQANRRLNLGTRDTNPIVSLQNDGTAVVKVLQITGGADLSEHFAVRGAVDVESASAASPIQAGLVVSIDPDEPGKLVISNQAYDRKVAGIISGAGGVRPGMLMSQSGSTADGDHPVALTGRVYCWADASYGPIAPGDLLTTSDTPGHAMKVTDYAKARGAVLGKAMAALKRGKGLVLALVTLQ